MTFEALHLENYRDFEKAIVKAEQMLPSGDDFVVMPPYSADYREAFLAPNTSLIVEASSCFLDAAAWWVLMSTTW